MGISWGGLKKMGISWGGGLNIEQFNFSTFQFQDLSIFSLILCYNPSCYQGLNIKRNGEVSENQNVCALIMN